MRELRAGESPSDLTADQGVRRLRAFGLTASPERIRLQLCRDADRDGAA